MVTQEGVKIWCMVTQAGVKIWRSTAIIVNSRLKVLVNSDTADAK